ncbi:hypothetical protein [Kitasatospora cheerisanensis]|uniref:Uncharacterized protein n=1 Tax=Kitasatospora cheerisanensis KCTC 2395 TaxID=1348663 RepID=A0A066ZBN1_9ACTN|nr:hypothetical protein [Kitasatospora cheerisanensis]KDN87701.1 hypothetical protein KCH_05360 [Kitasatospora cheerisanensis KCTC 2395]
MLSLRSIPPTARRRTPLTNAERVHVLDEFNSAVRYPDAHGGLACLPLFLDSLAEDEARPDGTRWIVDDNARLDMAALLRYCFPQPEVHVVAAEYGAAAHERGWLRLDRALRTDEYTSLVETTEGWAETDRTFDDVVQVYGRPSVVFGDQDPRSAKTLGYASDDRTAPLTVFHFDGAGDAPSARLLAFRSGDDLFGASMGFTPFGDAVADERERHRH